MTVPVRVGWSESELLIFLHFTLQVHKKSFFDNEAHSRAPRSGFVPPEPSQRTPARS